MIKLFKKQRLAFITSMYWFLLVYIVAALVWWFIALQNQNERMLNFKIMLLQKDDPAYQQKMQGIQEDYKRKTAQFISEGVTFLLVILAGALFVYRAARKQIKLSQQQQNFMMAVTHELKTPITVTQLNLETLRRHNLDKDKQQKLIDLSLEETARLNTLTSNILITSQLESGNYRINKQPVNFSQLVQQGVNEFVKRFPQRTFVQNITKEILVAGETSLLHMLISNLIDNAIKYSPKEKNISISLHTSNRRAILDVSDEGMGIDVQEKKKIFQKFYRVGNEATRTAKGTGLGLSISQGIASSHGGQLEYDPTSDHTKFTLKLPLKQAQKIIFKKSS